MLKKIICIICVLVMVFSLAGECFAANAGAAPALKETTCYSEGGKICCTLIFASAKGEKYRVYRRAANTKKYTRLGDVTAKGATYSYQDKTVKKGGIYYYTVRRIINGGKSLSAYHQTGIKGICFDTAPKLTLATLHTIITFNTTPHANSYTVFRKTDKTAWKAIQTLAASNEKTITFLDVYSKTMTTASEKKYLNRNCYIDPTENPLRYEVRANYTSGGMVSRGYYTKEGTCILAQPRVCELNIKGSSASLVWSGIPVAKSFNIYAKTSKNASWQKLKTVANDGKKLQRATVSVSKNYLYYTVRAFANIRGTLVGSSYDSNFGTLHRKYANQKALFLGDSFAIGRPYNGERLRYYTYSKQVEQVLGMKCDNISITATTLSDNYTTSGKQSIWSDQLKPMTLGKYPNIPDGFDKPQNLSVLWQYDYIVVAGGVNDHATDAPLGNVNSTDIKTVHGSLNRIKQTIKLINKQRRAHGKEDVRVIWLAIGYAKRVGGNFTVIEDRMKAKNALGITMKEYTDTILSAMNDKEIDIKFIPSDVILNEKNCIYVSADNLHYTKLGYAKLGNIIAGMMMNW